jgi:hypothetical protein
MVQIYASDYRIGAGLEWYLMWYGKIAEGIVWFI